MWARRGRCPGGGRGGCGVVTGRRRGEESGKQRFVSFVVRFFRTDAQTRDSANFARFADSSAVRPRRPVALLFREIQSINISSRDSIAPTRARSPWRGLQACHSWRRRALRDRLEYQRRRAGSRGDSAWAATAHEGALADACASVRKNSDRPVPARDGDLKRRRGGHRPREAIDRDERRGGFGGRDAQPSPRRRGRGSVPVARDVRPPEAQRDGSRA